MFDTRSDNVFFTNSEFKVQFASQFKSTMIDRSLKYETIDIEVTCGSRKNVVQHVLYIFESQKNLYFIQVDDNRAITLSTFNCNETIPHIYYSFNQNDTLLLNKLSMSNFDEIADITNIWTDEERLFVLLPCDMGSMLYIFNVTLLEIQNVVNLSHLNSKIIQCSELEVYKNYLIHKPITVSLYEILKYQEKDKRKSDEFSIFQIRNSGITSLFNISQLFPKSYISQYKIVDDTIYFLRYDFEDNSIYFTSIDLLNSRLLDNKLCLEDVNETTILSSFQQLCEDYKL